MNRKLAARIASVFMALCLCAASPLTGFAQGEQYRSNKFTGVYEKTASQNLVAIEKPYQLAAENKNLELYVNPENLAILIHNKKTGYHWCSEPADTEDSQLNDRWKNYFHSALIIEYFEQKQKIQDSQSEEEALLTSPKTALTLEMQKDGFTANIQFGISDISVRFQVKLEENGIRLLVNNKEIIENGAKKLVSLTLYPLLGATQPGAQNGYFFLPDGDGALVNFNTVYQNINVNYAKRYFGADLGIYSPYNTEENLRQELPLRYPVYGVVHGVESNAILVHSEKGAENAELLMYPAGVRTNYYFITNRYLYRQNYLHKITTEKQAIMIMQDRIPIDIEESITLLSGEDAGYTGMAKTYRLWLQNSGYLTQKQAEAEDIPIQLNFLSAGTVSGLFGNKSIPMTTLKDLESMVQELNEKGVHSIQASLENAGQSTLIPNEKKRFALRGDIGTWSEWEAVQNELEAAGNHLSWCTNYYSISENSPGIVLEEDVLKQVNRQYLLFDNQMGGTHFTSQWLNAFGFLKVAEGDLEKLESLPVHNMSAVLPLSASNYGNQSYTRSDSLKMLAETVEKLGKTVSLGAYQEDVIYTQYPWIDRMYGIGLETSLYSYVTDTVPFTSLVLGGSIALYSGELNTSAEISKDILKLIEWNIYPAFRLTQEDSAKLLYSDEWWVISSKFDDWKEEITDCYQQVNNVLRQVQGAAMTNHKALASGVVLVQYDNGVDIIVNYTAVPFEYRQTEIGPQSAEVIKFEK